MKNSEKKLAKSNNWKTFKSKLKTLGWAGALSLLITLNACGPADTKVKKAAERYQEATEQVEKAKESLKNKQESFEDAQKALQEAEQEAINAKENLKQESSRL